MEELVIQYGLYAIAFFLIIDDLGIPFPTSTIVFSSAVLAGSNPEIDVKPIIIMAILLPPIGNNILFYWGKHGARTWLETHGHKFFLPNKRLQKAEVFFGKYGEKTIFLGSMITTIRPVLSLIAGSSNMHSVKFSFYNFLGICIWACGIVGSGYFLGESIWKMVKEHWEITLGIVLIIMAIQMTRLLKSEKNDLNN